MIYVEDKSIEAQFRLLEFLSAGDNFTLIGWQYPEVKNSPIGLLPSNAFHEKYEPVTTYSSGEKAVHTKPMKALPSKLSYVIKFKEQIRRSFDSFCLYRPGSSEWYACAIGHEGMCLVRDIKILKELKDKGFNASTEKPDWW
jgi:hypothetical protein